MNAGFAGKTVDPLRTRVIPERLRVHDKALYKSTFTFTYGENSKQVSDIEVKLSVDLLCIDVYLQYLLGLLLTH